MFGLSNSPFLLACITRFLVGLGQGPTLVLGTRLLDIWFYASEFPIFYGIFIRESCFGGFLSRTPHEKKIDWIKIDGIIFRIYLINNANIACWYMISFNRTSYKA